MDNLHLGYQIFLIGFLTIVSVATLVGNGLVILAWIFHIPVRKPQNIYLVSLASADILVGFFLVPSMIGGLRTDGWPFGRLWCQIYILLAWLLSTVSVFHLIAIALDRYHIIFDTLTYMQRRTTPFFLRRILLIWTVALWLIYPPMQDWNGIGDRVEGFGICVTNMSIDLSVHLAFGSYFLPMVFLGSTYIAIYRKLQERRERSESMQSFGARTSLPSLQQCSLSVGSITSSSTVNRFGVDLLNKNRQAAKMLGIIIAAFSLSWLPFLLGFSIIGLLPEEQRTSLIAWWMPIIIAIGCSNSAMNPIIYAFCNPDFRQGFRKVLVFYRN